jgi:hypothetical protein
MIQGGAGSGDGIPQMHPMKSSNPIFKATSLLHGLSMKMRRPPSMKVRMPRL